MASDRPRFNLANYLRGLGAYLSHRWLICNRQSSHRSHFEKSIKGQQTSTFVWRGMCVSVRALATITGIIFRSVFAGLSFFVTLLPIGNGERSPRRAPADVTADCNELLFGS
jgi:hypothetical protein